MDLVYGYLHGVFVYVRNLVLSLIGSISVFVVFGLSNLYWFIIVVIA